MKLKVIVKSNNELGFDATEKMIKNLIDRNLVPRNGELIQLAEQDVIKFDFITGIIRNISYYSENKTLYVIYTIQKWI